MKSKRLFIRVTQEQKEKIKANAEAHHLSITDYILNCSLNNSLNTKITFEQLIANTLAENNFYNNLLINKELSNRSKQIISGELKKYV